VNHIAPAHLAQVDEKFARLGALRAELDRVISEGVVPVADCRILSALSGGPARDR